MRICTGSAGAEGRGSASTVSASLGSSPALRVLKLVDEEVIVFDLCMLYPPTIEGSPRREHLRANPAYGTCRSRCLRAECDASPSTHRACSAHRHQHCCPFADHDAWHFGLVDRGRDHRARSIITSKFSLAHIAAVVNNDLCHLISGHCWTCDQTAHKVSTQNGSVI